MIVKINKNTAKTQKTDTDEKVQAQIEQLARLADLMDSRFKIPGLPVRLGIDTIIGLTPGIGDTAGLGVSAYIITQAMRLGVEKPLIRRMMFNVGIDWLQ